MTGTKKNVQISEEIGIVPPALTRVQVKGEQHLKPPKFEHIFELRLGVMFATN